jgi:hypothetical protein
LGHAAPHLAQFQTWDGVSSCTPTGTTGEWHTASGNSGGWPQWRVDLSRWAGRTVEVSISYASDWGTQGLGAFIDDVVLPDGTSTSFENGLDGWTVSGAPPGSAANANDWVRTGATGFPVGASITTPRSILMGFGLEGISTERQRDTVMGRAMGHLLGAGALR